MKRSTRLAIFCCASLCTGGALASEMPAIVSDYDAWARQADPVRAAQRGDTAAMRRWPDNSPAAVAARKAQLERFGARLDAAGEQLLEKEEQTNHALLVERVAVALAGFGFDEERIAFISGDGFYTTADYAALNTQVRNPAEAEAWLARLQALPAYYEREVTNLRRGIASGFTQPRATVERAIADVGAQLQRDTQSSPLLEPLAELPPAIPATLASALRERAARILGEQIQPAQQQLLDFFAQEYLPHARDAIAVSSLPGGREWYRYLVRRHTTTEMTPEQVHALGETEVARIRERMQQVLRELDFEGSLADFIAHLRTEPRFYVEPSVYGEKASEIAKRADALMPRYFGLLPRLSYGVQAIPAGLESSSAGYLPGSPEQGVAGLVVYKPWLAGKMPTFGLPAWVLHEGVPGHHLQIALAQENAALPEFRRNDDITAYVEGWGLYAEMLGEEMGIYRDPYEHFGRLSLEMWRACRLLIDTGIHWMGWPRERAAACLQHNSALAQAEIDYELDRYIAWPAQALAYKIGEQRLIALRREAEQRLGERFDLRAFHDLVLGAGPMPLGLLEARVERWICSQERAAPQA